MSDLLHELCIKKKDISTKGRRRDTARKWKNFTLYSIHLKQIKMEQVRKFLVMAPILCILPNEIVRIVVEYYQSLITKFVILESDSPPSESLSLCFGNFVQFTSLNRRETGNFWLCGNDMFYSILIGASIIFQPPTKTMRMDDYLKNKKTLVGKEIFHDEREVIGFPEFIQDLKNVKDKKKKYASSWLTRDYDIIYVPEDPRDAIPLLDKYFKEVQRKYTKIKEIDFLIAAQHLCAKDILLIRKIRCEEQLEDLVISRLTSSNLLQILKELKYMGMCFSCMT
jgi:hypothetical protein